MLAHRTSTVTTGARRMKSSRCATTKISERARQQEDCRWNQVRPEMIYPPATDRWNGKNDCDDQDAFAIGDSKDGSKQDQRKQNR